MLKNDIDETPVTPKVIGLDEAGRGPVIGPMVIAGVLLELNNKEKTKTFYDLDLKDSKKLSKKKRESLYEEIQKLAKVDKVVVTAKEIDDQMKIINLNKIELNGFSSIINKFYKDEYGLDENRRNNGFLTYIDACSSNETSFSNQLKAKLINKNIDLIAEHKADDNYKIVSAASIIAKVTRDNIIDEYNERYNSMGYTIGSGYPSDPKTKKFLKQYLEDNKELPDIVRFSWNTTKKLLKEYDSENGNIDLKCENLLKWVKN
ncbi:ribonuclease HII [Methanococcus voltae]|uniref:ribonuclease HII n=1 Tax=Methanococcus voltae TaxID=2188 RepID=UPI001AE4C31A|nr:ribonuclease HII [Methanococcus voltae]